MLNSDLNWCKQFTFYPIRYNSNFSVKDVIRANTNFPVFQYYFDKKLDVLKIIFKLLMSNIIVYYLEDQIIIEI